MLQTGHAFQKRGSWEERAWWLPTWPATSGPRARQRGLPAARQMGSVSQRWLTIDRKGKLPRCAQTGGSAGTAVLARRRSGLSLRGRDFLNTAQLRLVPSSRVVGYEAGRSFLLLLSPVLNIYKKIVFNGHFYLFIHLSLLEHLLSGHLTLLKIPV